MTATTTATETTTAPATETAFTTRRTITRWAMGAGALAVTVAYYGPLLAQLCSTGESAGFAILGGTLAILAACALLWLLRRTHGLVADLPTDDPRVAAWSGLFSTVTKPFRVTGAALALISMGALILGTLNGAGMILTAALAGWGFTTVTDMVSTARGQARTLMALAAERGINLRREFSATAARYAILFIVSVIEVKTGAFLTPAG